MSLFSCVYLCGYILLPTLINKKRLKINKNYRYTSSSDSVTSGQLQHYIGMLNDNVHIHSVNVFIVRS